MDYYERIIEHYADKSVPELNELLDQARAAMHRADAIYQRSRLRSDKDAIETASRRFYNLQVVIRNRGESSGADNISNATTEMAKAAGSKSA